MKKIAATLLSTMMLCALLAAPALARDQDGYYRGRGNGLRQYRPNYEAYQRRPEWNWNHAEWRERRDWDDHWRWHGPDWGFHRDYGRR